MITPEHVRLICGPVCSVERAAACAPALELALLHSDAHTVTRAAALLAQVAWETGQLRWITEDEMRGTAYEGRRSLGNREPGDGVRFRGRGFIHLTGRSNYREAGEALGLDLEVEPDLAADLDVAALVTGWYWTKHKLNQLVDARDFRSVTEAINGLATEGPPSYHERRERHYRTALEVLGLTATL